MTSNLLTRVRVEEPHLKLMVITDNERLLVNSQIENTFTTIRNAYTFSCNNHMNSFTVLYSDSLSRKENIGNQHPSCH